jgi:hypothetical protein
VRTRHLARALILVVAVAVAAPAARAGDDFDAVVKFLRTQYGAEKRDGLPWIARVAIKIAKPAGVKSLKLQTLDGLSGAGGGERLDALLKSRLGADWRPLVRVYSKRDREHAFVYIRATKSDLEVMLVALDGDEATVLKAKVDPAKLDDLSNAIAANSN